MQQAIVCTLLHRTHLAPLARLQTFISNYACTDALSAHLAAIDTFRNDVKKQGYSGKFAHTLAKRERRKTQHAATNSTGEALLIHRTTFHSREGVQFPCVCGVNIAYMRMGSSWSFRGSTPCPSVPMGELFYASSLPGTNRPEKVAEKEKSRFA